MDEIEHLPFALLPMSSLSLRLARTAIKMWHGPRWKIDKLNPDHDLVICLTGSAVYEIGNSTFELGPGEAMLIPSYQRFRGRYAGDGEVYSGVAQHFSLELFGRGDLIPRLQLAQKISFGNWDAIRPLVQHYRESSLTTATTLSQHHQFMVLLLAFLEEAFQGWRAEELAPEGQDHLSLHIMLVASRLSSDPLGAGVDEALGNVPYNPDYFRRAFRDRLGLTPTKYRELKRMEFAVNRLSMGLPVKAVALELGYTDPYFFSRMFKKYIGTSPSRYRDRDRLDSARS